mmetsp:Transcript_28109/g.65987  ORF Transcript_28109/g.65987 Transcript_28109/m.65987 type:complete len:345 (+) Transcript_28109:306-1340(+)
MLCKRKTPRRCIRVAKEEGEEEEALEEGEHEHEYEYQHDEQEQQDDEDFICDCSEEYEQEDEYEDEQEAEAEAETEEARDEQDSVPWKSPQELEAAMALFERYQKQLAIEFGSDWNDDYELMVDEKELYASYQKFIRLRNQKENQMQMQKQLEDEDEDDDDCEEEEEENEEQHSPSPIIDLRAHEEQQQQQPLSDPQSWSSSSQRIPVEQTSHRHPREADKWNYETSSDAPDDHMVQHDPFYLEREWSDVQRIGGDTPLDLPSGGATGNQTQHTQRGGSSSQQTDSRPAEHEEPFATTSASATASATTAEKDQAKSTSQSQSTQHPETVVTIRRGNTEIVVGSL